MVNEEKPITFAYLRKRAGLTQRKISLLMDVTVSTVSLWETGGQRPRLYPEQTQKLLQVLNCTLEELVEAFSQEWKQDWRSNPTVLYAIYGLTYISWAVIVSLQFPGIGHGKRRRTNNVCVFEEACWVNPTPNSHCYGCNCWYCFPMGKRRAKTAFVSRAISEVIADTQLHLRGICRSV